MHFEKLDCIAWVFHQFAELQVMDNYHEMFDIIQKYLEKMAVHRQFRLRLEAVFFIMVYM